MGIANFYICFVKEAIAVMIIWINGAFGSGKTSVAEAIHKKVSHSFIYDPEQVGYFLWDNFPNALKRKGNFQHMDIWRECNYNILKHIDANYTGAIIVPMTLYVKQYYDEIPGRLASDGISVKSFILSAAKPTIVNRLAKRRTLINKLLQRRDDGERWAAQHIDVCINAFEIDIPGEKIDTEDKSIDEIAGEIIRRTQIIV